MRVSSFTVVFKVTADKQVGVPVSEYITHDDSNDDKFYINTRFYTDNVSYVSYDGKNWQDLYYLAGEGKSQVACIKAFTVLDTIRTSMKLEAVNDYNPVEFKATVTNQYGAPVKSGKVTFTIDGKQIEADVKNGIATTTYRFASIGPKTATARFSAYGYVSSSDTAHVTIDILPSKLTSSNVVADYSSGKSLVATLKDAYGNPISGAEVKIVVGTISKALITDSKGKVSQPLDELLPDSYTALIAFLGNEVYRSSSTTAKVTVNKLDTMLTAEYDSAAKNIVATVKDAKGNAVKGIKVGFDIDGVKYVLTDANGQAKYSTTGLAKKVYDVGIMAYSNGIYRDSNVQNVTVDLTRISTSLTAYDVTTIYKGGKSLVATLKDNSGKAISGARVTIRIGDVTKILTTDNDGQVSLPLDGFVPDTYTATISFNGDDVYDSSSASAKVTISKAQGKVYLRNALYFVLQTKMVQLTLWDSNGKPIAGKTVHITLDEWGWRYSGVTDNDGNAYIRVGVGFGSHSVTVSFDGDDCYTANEKTGRVRVIKETPSLMLPGAYTKFKATDKIKTVKIYLKDRYDKPLLPNTKVFIKVNGQTYFGLIDINGIASISLNINRAGTYNAELIYMGNTAYNAVKRPTTIRIV